MSCRADVDSDREGGKEASDDHDSDVQQQMLTILLLEISKMMIVTMQRTSSLVMLHHPTWTTTVGAHDPAALASACLRYGCMRPGGAIEAALTVADEVFHTSPPTSSEAARATGTGLSALVRSRIWRQLREHVYKDVEEALEDSATDAERMLLDGKDMSKEETARWLSKATLTFDGSGEWDVSDAALAHSWKCQCKLCSTVRGLMSDAPTSQSCAQWREWVQLQCTTRPWIRSVENLCVRRLECSISTFVATQ